MSRVARAFDAQTRPGNVRGFPRGSQVTPPPELPWGIVAAGSMPPMMFELRLQDGSWQAFAYHDIRQIRFRDAGHVELHLRAPGKVTITIEGRNLRELASSLSMALVRWIEEHDPRSEERPEDAADVSQITIEWGSE